VAAKHAGFVLQLAQHATRALTKGAPQAENVCDAAATAIAGLYSLRSMIKCDRHALLKAVCQLIVRAAECELYPLVVREAAGLAELCTGKTMRYRAASMPGGGLLGGSLRTEGFPSCVALVSAFPRPGRGHDHESARHVSSALTATLKALLEMKLFQEAISLACSSLGQWMLLPVESTPEPVVEALVPMAGNVAASATPAKRRPPMVPTSTKGEGASVRGSADSPEASLAACTRSRELCIRALLTASRQYCSLADAGKSLSLAAASAWLAVSTGNLVARTSEQWLEVLQLAIGAASASIREAELHALDASGTWAVSASLPREECCGLVRCVPDEASLVKPSHAAAVCAVEAMTPFVMLLVSPSPPWRDHVAPCEMVELALTSLNWVASFARLSAKAQRADLTRRTGTLCVAMCRAMSAMTPGDAVAQAQLLLAEASAQALTAQLLLEDWLEGAPTSRAKRAGRSATVFQQRYPGRALDLDELSCTPHASQSIVNAQRAPQGPPPAHALKLLQSAVASASKVQDLMRDATVALEQAERICSALELVDLCHDLLPLVKAVVDMDDVASSVGSPQPVPSKTPRAFTPPSRAIPESVMRAQERTRTVRKQTVFHRRARATPAIASLAASTPARRLAFGATPARKLAFGATPQMRETSRQTAKKPTVRKITFAAEPEEEEEEDDDDVPVRAMRSLHIEEPRPNAWLQPLAEIFAACSGTVRAIVGSLSVDTGEDWMERWSDPAAGMPLGSADWACAEDAMTTRKLLSRLCDSLQGEAGVRMAEGGEVGDVQTLLAQAAGVAARTGGSTGLDSVTEIAGGMHNLATPLFNMLDDEESPLTRRSLASLLQCTATAWLLILQTVKPDQELLMDALSRADLPRRCKRVAHAWSKAGEASRGFAWNVLAFSTASIVRMDLDDFATAFESPSSFSCQQGWLLEASSKNAALLVDALSPEWLLSQAGRLETSHLSELCPVFPDGAQIVLPIAPAVSIACSLCCVADRSKGLSALLLASLCQTACAAIPALLSDEMLHGTLSDSPAVRQAAVQAAVARYCLRTLAKPTDSVDQAALMLCVDAATRCSTFLATLWRAEACRLARDVTLLGNHAFRAMGTAAEGGLPRFPSSGIGVALKCEVPDDVGGSSQEEDDAPGTAATSAEEGDSRFNAVVSRCQEKAAGTARLVRSILRVCQDVAASSVDLVRECSRSACQVEYRTLFCTITARGAAWSQDASLADLSCSTASDLVTVHSGALLEAAATLVTAGFTAQAAKILSRASTVAKDLVCGGEKDPSVFQRALSDPVQALEQIASRTPANELALATDASTARVVMSQLRVHPALCASVAGQEARAWQAVAEAAVEDESGRTSPVHAIHAASLVTDALFQETSMLRKASLFDPAADAAWAAARLSARLPGHSRFLNALEQLVLVEGSRDRPWNASFLSSLAPGCTAWSGDVPPLKKSSSPSHAGRVPLRELQISSAWSVIASVLPKVEADVTGAAWDLIASAIRRSEEPFEEWMERHGADQELVVRRLLRLAQEVYQPTMPSESGICEARELLSRWFSEARVSWSTLERSVCAKDASLSFTLAWVAYQCAHRQCDVGLRAAAARLLVVTCPHRTALQWSGLGFLALEASGPRFGSEMVRSIASKFATPPWRWLSLALDCAESFPGTLTPVNLPWVLVSLASASLSSSLALEPVLAVPSTEAEWNKATNVPLLKGLRHTGEERLFIAILRGWANGPAVQLRTSGPEIAVSSLAMDDRSMALECLLLDSGRHVRKGSVLAAGWAKEETARWWREREEHDSRMEAIVRNLAQSLSSDTAELPLATAVDGIDRPDAPLASLRVVDLRDLLKQAGLPTSGLKAALVERLEAFFSAPTPVSQAPDKVAPSNVELCLAPGMDVLPWDAAVRALYPSASAVVRGWTSPLALFPRCVASLKVDTRSPESGWESTYLSRWTTGRTSVSTRLGSALVNPSGDLGSTERALRTTLASLPEWQVVCGRKPKPEEFVELVTSRPVFLYCGHGAAWSICSPAHLTTSARPVGETALIMGCSSARPRTDGEASYAPDEHYQLGGALASTGCLWDVTDGDIDRLTQTMLKALGSSEHATLSAAVNAGRSACRLSFLTGAAVVMRGVDVRCFRE
jgi:hypothetical protein